MNTKYIDIQPYSPNTTGEVNVKIYDVLGKLTAKFKFEKTDESFSQELNLQGLMPGVYLTEIRIGGEKVVAEKVVVK